MSVSQSQEYVKGVANCKVTYEKRSALFGLLSWWSEVKVETVGREIHIITDNKVDKIYLNGKRIETNSL